jgi:TctA family transporter
VGEIGVLWATPIAEVLSVFVALGLLFTFFKKSKQRFKEKTLSIN